jgi:hypothetical protein
MYGFLGLIVIIAIWYFISYVSVKVDETKIDIQKSRKRKSDSKLQQKRYEAKVHYPSTLSGHYPILLEPLDKEVYHFGEGYHWIKPGSTTATNFKDDIFGAAEKHFLSNLLIWFDKEKIKHNSLSVRVNKDVFIPDFTYVDEPNGIFICIEIDEPYSFKTNEPIHYTSKDDMRNIYLQRGGWAIIRFTERQTVLYPSECCKFIAEYLSYAYIDKSKLGNLKFFSDVLKEECWTRQQGEKMRLQDYRKTYLQKLTEKQHTT